MLTTTQTTEKSYDVRHGRRTIGSLVHMSGAVPTGWRFIANKPNVAAMMPVPAPVFATADEALADLRSRFPA